MNYISVCSGIEAATVAWHPLGWRPLAFAEVDRFPSQVLKHHYPTVPNVGDFTAIKGDEFGTVGLLVGGIPCQDFSVAGLRAGMDGQRGQLTIEFASLAARLRPRWLVWENVPGVLSIDGGRAFGTFLGLLGECGYGVAYRVLDAQYFGVPQRRRRVFVVGCLGDWRRAAAVLFERHSLSGHPAPRREKGKGSSYDVAPCVAASGRGVERPGDSRGQDCLIAFGGNNTAGPIEVATAVNACGTASGRMDFESETFVCPTLRAGGNSTGGDRPPGTDVDTADSLVVTHSLRADGFDASEDGTGRGTPLVPIAFTANDHGNDAGETAPTLRAGGHSKSHANAGVMPAVAFGWSEELTASRELAGTIQRGGQGGRHEGVMTPGMAVRRLTPRECERLQGFPDDYTKISEKTADGPRYKALGNSMAVPVMRWIGERIQMVGDL